YSQLRGDPDAGTFERALLAAQRGEPDRVGGYLLSRLEGRAAEAGLVYEALARGYLRTDRPAEALDCLDRWLGHPPDDVAALLWRGQVLERWNDPEGALDSYRRAVAADPADGKGRRLLALALVRADRAREAVEHLELLRRQGPDAEVLLGLA